MTKDEALKMAMYELEIVNLKDGDTYNACKEALDTEQVREDAVPAQEPRLVSYALDGSTCTLNIDGEEVYFNREQPVQEPVAWMMVYREPEHGAAYLTFDKPTREQKISHHPYELYTHPHQWQGLSIKEEDDFIQECYMVKTESEAHQLVLAIEQALKEKNCG
jgi:hypothetical protein